MFHVSPDCMSHIKNYFKKIPFIRENLILLLFLLFCSAFLAFRAQQYSFEHAWPLLSRNLLLATIPYFCAVFIYKCYLDRPRNIFFIISLLLWLLFYPNALYLITDFIYLKQQLGVPLWFDILLFFSYAWTGLILGLASLRLIQVVVDKNFGKLTGWLFAIIAIILGSLGIYIGRYLRWNSWDVIKKPQLLIELLDTLSSPPQCKEIYTMTLFFSVFFLLAYLSIIYFMSPSKKNCYCHSYLPSIINK